MFLSNVLFVKIVSCQNIGQCYYLNCSSSLITYYQYNLNRVAYIKNKRLKLKKNQSIIFEKNMLKVQWKI